MLRFFTDGTVDFIIEYDAKRRPRSDRANNTDVPIVFTEGPYRFFFYSGDRYEPQHVHVARDNRIAKFWLDPVRMQRSGGMRRPEILRILQIIEENHRLLLEAWDDYFND